MEQFLKNTSFRGRLLPEINGLIVGYAKLIDRYNLSVPLCEKLSFISERHRRYNTDRWAVFTPRHEPDDNLAGHLTFALRYEGVETSVLSQLFAIINPEIIARWVHQEPTGRYSRRVWFLYEWLTGKQLDVPDTTMGNYVDVLDPKLQPTASASLPSRRHRVNNNLLKINDRASVVQSTEQWGESLSQTHSQEQIEGLKEAINKHFDIPEQELEHLVRFLHHNFKRR